jgi:hypothetical protein
VGPKQCYDPHLGESRPVVGLGGAVAGQHPGMVRTIKKYPLYLQTKAAIDEGQKMHDIHKESYLHGQGMDQVMYA